MPLQFFGAVLSRRAGGGLYAEGGNPVSSQPQPRSKEPWSFQSSSDAPRKLLDEISEPGAYVCHGSGDLLRVTGTGVPSDGAEAIKSGGSEPVYVTLVSKDPFVPISRARIAAANLDIEISF